jgi:hypothetical protein
MALTKPSVSLVRARDTDDRGMLVYDGVRLISDPALLNLFTEITPIRQVYDEDTGTIIIEMSNGQKITISGFVRLDDIEYHLAKGRRGERGRSGIDSPDGKDGKPGERGCVGCEGPVGDTGLKGLRGLRGETGKPGCEGVEGPQGIQGRLGECGPKGSEGLPGLPGELGGLHVYILESTDDLKAFADVKPPTNSLRVLNTTDASLLALANDKAVDVVPIDKIINPEFSTTEKTFIANPETFAAEAYGSTDSPDVDIRVSVDSSSGGVDVSLGTVPTVDISADKLI